jgi:hypothetical protein
MRAALALLLLLAIACSGRETGPEHFAPKGEHGVFERHGSKNIGFKALALRRAAPPVATDRSKAW